MNYGVNWIAVPEPLYIAIAILSIVLFFLSAFFLLRVKRKNKRYYLVYAVILIASIVIGLLIFQGVIVANTMIGGS